jgi:hypothetical protein
MNKNSTYKDFIRHENELTKLKIQAEFGIDLNNESELNPAIENIWLNQILEYERAMINNKKITVGSFLENPVYISVDQLSEEQLPLELQRLMELLHSKNIVIDSLAGVDDREMYRFITSELFLTEMDSCIPKNMIVCYIYEEFHPNDAYDVRRTCIEFLDFLGTEEDWRIDSNLFKATDEIEKIKLENLSRKFKLFNNAFDEISIEEINIHTLNIQDFTAYVFFDIRLSVLIPESKGKQILSGNGKFECTKDFGIWFVKDFSLEGIV